MMKVPMTGWWEAVVLHGNFPETGRGRQRRLKGLVLAGNRAVRTDIAGEVAPICTIEQVVSSPAEALQRLRTDEFSVLFVFLGSENLNSNMDMVRQIGRISPDVNVFMCWDQDQPVAPDTVIEAMRLGVRDFVIPQEDGDGCYLTALQRFLGQAEGTARRGFIFSFFSLKGGQGVTSLSVNLADQIQALTGGPVLLLDMNLYMGDVASMINMTPDFTPYDLIKDLSRMDQNLLFSSLYQHERGFYVLPTPAEISDAEQVHRDQISAMLGLLRHYFAYIVMDLPHDFSERTLAAVDASDRTMILLVPDLVSVKNAQHVLNFFRELNYSEEGISLVLNRRDAKSLLQPEDVEMVLKQELFATVANDWAPLVKANRKGEVLGESHGTRRITADIRRLAARLTGIEHVVMRDGILNRLFNWV